jgi:hypothetical protein
MDRGDDIGSEIQRSRMPAHISEWSATILKSAASPYGDVLFEPCTAGQGVAKST